MPGALLVAAFVLRLPSIAFGLPSPNNQDEMMFELGALRMLHGPTLNPILGRRMFHSGADLAVPMGMWPHRPLDRAASPL